MIFSKLWLWLGGLGAALLSFFIAGWIIVFLVGRHDKRIVEEAKSAAKIAVFDSTGSALAHQSDSVRVVYVDRYHTYTTVRDSIIKARPSDSGVASIVQRCDQVIVSCAERAAVDSQRIANAQAEIKQLKAMKAVKPPRFSAYALAGMDVLRTEPIVQVGTDTRIVGPLSLAAFVEGAKNKTDVQTRAVVALKFSFR